MAEVYSDKGTHHGSMSWILLAVIAAIMLAIIIAVLT